MQQNEQLNEAESLKWKMQSYPVVCDEDGLHVQHTNTSVQQVKSFFNKNNTHQCIYIYNVKP